MLPIRSTTTMRMTIFISSRTLNLFTSISYSNKP
jgi:hypothetical protein